MSGATCKDCPEAAKVWHWGGYTSTCSDCAVRALAKSPKMIRQAEYERLATPEHRRDLIAKVQAEARRIAELREATRTC